MRLVRMVRDGEEGVLRVRFKVISEVKHLTWLLNPIISKTTNLCSRQQTEREKAKAKGNGLLRTPRALSLGNRLESNVIFTDGTAEKRKRNYLHRHGREPRPTTFLSSANNYPADRTHNACGNFECNLSKRTSYSRATCFPDAYLRISYLVCRVQREIGHTSRRTSVRDTCASSAHEARHVDIHS